MELVDRCDNGSVKATLLVSPRFVHLLSLVLLLGYIILGLSIYRDYGVPIDEYSQIDLGRVNYERIVYGSPEIQGHYDRHYGPAFEVPLYVASNALVSVAGLDVVAARHLGVFLFFVLSLICFYIFMSVLNGHPFFGLIGVTFLAVYPRFFAESFYNSKDIAFVSATIFVLLAYWYTKDRSWLSFLILAVATGFSIAVRVQGLLLFAVISVVIFLDASVKYISRLGRVAVYVSGTLASVFAMFPLFWNNFIQNAIGFWRVSANSLGVPTFYFGEFYTSPIIPWHYHFVWVGITGMLSVLAAGVLGAGVFIKQIVKGDKRSANSNVVYAAMFLIITGTFVASVFFHPRSYDGWRHVYYIYPCIVAFAVYALRKAIEGVNKRAINMPVLMLGAFFTIDLFLSVNFLIKNHPNQYVYFNLLAGGYSRAKKSFDFDYWGISQSRLLEYLMNFNIKEGTTIYFQQILPYTERVMIPQLTGRGMRVTAVAEDADIYVTINRDFKEAPPIRFRKIYAVSVDGADLSAVYASDEYTGK